MTIPVCTSGTKALLDFWNIFLNKVRLGEVCGYSLVDENDASIIIKDTRIRAGNIICDKHYLQRCVKLNFEPSKCRGNTVYANIEDIYLDICERCNKIV